MPIFCLKIGAPKQLQTSIKMPIFYLKIGAPKQFPVFFITTGDNFPKVLNFWKVQVE